MGFMPPGIGGYDLRSPADRAFAFDFDSSGKLDHLVLYRPGTGTIWILKNSGGTFSPVYHQGDPGTGIGGYDLKSPADLAFAFDYDSSGKLDHLVLYRPGAGAIFILKNANGNFSPVFIGGNPTTGVYSGIGGYDLKSPADLAFAFDYDGSGKLDHLVLYRPGAGAMFILDKASNNFAPVLITRNPVTGVYWGYGGSGYPNYDLKSPADLAFAFDYDGSGNLDYLVLYRPGVGATEISNPKASNTPYFTGTPPIISSFAPTHGLVGTTVSISGEGFWGPRFEVNFVNVEPAKIVGGGSNVVEAVVPPGAGTGPIGVWTYGGNWGAVSPGNFVVDAPPVYVTVPSVIKHTLQDAVSLLEQAQLQVGTVSGATGLSNLVVVGQDPTAGTRVQAGSAVNLTDAAPVVGISSVTLANDLADGDSVYVWLYNGSTGQWSEQNGGNILAFGNTVTFSLQSGQGYVVEAIDPTWCGGSNDPTNADCVRWSQSFVGDANGQRYAGQIT
jgi:hypothetical protein